MLDYIREARTSKEAWGNLKKIFAVNTTIRKLQHSQELNNNQQRDMSIESLKIKESCDSLGSINVNIDDDEMVQICLDNLASRISAIRSVVLVRENSPSFFDLQLKLLAEETHIRTRSNVQEGHMLYSILDGGGDTTMEEEADSAKADTTKNNPMNTISTIVKDIANMRGGAYGRRGSNHAGPSRQNNSIQCRHCGKFGHYEAECRKKKSESAFTSRQLTNYASNSDYEDRGGIFVLSHRANSMSASSLTSTLRSENEWFVDSGASNHMMSHEDWFRELRKPEQPNYVGMKQFTPFRMSAMSHSGKMVNKPT